MLDSLGGFRAVYVSAGDANTELIYSLARSECALEHCAFHLLLFSPFFFLSSPGHLLDASSDRIPDTELVLNLIVLA